MPEKPDGENWSLEDLAMHFEQTADARHIWPQPKAGSATEMLQSSSGVVGR
jgi:hypothetical protein